MLGQLGFVQATLETRAALLHVPGPHGIPLIAHARRGSERSARVLAYLVEFEKTHPRPDADG